MVISISCNKDDNSQNSNLDLLTSGPWIQESIVYDPPIDFMGKGKLISDVLPFLPICETDDLFFFYKSGSVIRDEGLSKCSPTDPQIIKTGSWIFINDNQIEVVESIIKDTVTFKNGKLILIEVFTDGSETTTLKLR